MGNDYTLHRRGGLHMALDFVGNRRRMYDFKEAWDDFKSVLFSREWRLYHPSIFRRAVEMARNAVAMFRFEMARNRAYAMLPSGYVACAIDTLKPIESSLAFRGSKYGFCINGNDRRDLKSSARFLHAICDAEEAGADDEEF